MTTTAVTALFTFTSRRRSKPWKNPGSIIQGIYRDRLFDASKQPKFDSGWKSNTIMASFHVLLARFIVHDPDLFQYQKGRLIMRLGAGSQAWDTVSGPPAVQPAKKPSRLTRISCSRKTTRKTGIWFGLSE
jgi:hypothetical protein